MKAHQLKNAILQLAVQGKLVPQNPNDEPASKLLERIAAEKRRRIKAGEIKKDKRDSTIVRRGASFYEIANTTERCIDDELPFDLPKGWEWARFGSVVVNYDSKRRPVTKEKRKCEFGHYDYYGATGVIDKVDDYIFDGEYLMIGEDGGNFYTCRDNSFVASGRFWANNHVHIIQPIINNIFFLKHYLDSCNLPAMGLINGIAVPKLNQTNLNSILIPIPPLAEQRRIVDRLESLLPLVEAYGKAEAELSELDARFPDMLKKSILQDAVQGKLVPQNPNDEPASVLLERIPAEKQRLIKEGKIKKDKRESVIFRRDNSHYENLDGVERCIDGEIPFEIPENWGWVRFGNISSYAETKQKVNAANADPAIWGLDLEDIEKGGKLIVRKTVGERKAIGDKTVFAKGDILYSKLRPYLLKILIAHDDGICTPEIVPFRVYGGINPNYIVNYLKSPCVDNLINSITYGVKMPRVGTETMTSLLVPIPPLNEQHRIVQRIEELLPLIKGL